MANQFDICNRALSDIAARVTIATFTDPNPASVNCGLWYDKLRRQLIRAAPWGFARRQLTLTQVGDLIPDNTSPYPWMYKYAYPSDCLKLRYILPPMNPVNNTVAPSVGLPLAAPYWMAPSRTNRFIVINDVNPIGGGSTKCLVSNVAQAIGVYNGDVTDPNQWDDLFEGALTAALSYHLVMPLTGNVEMRGQFKQAAEQAILEARAADGNEAIPKADICVDWIETRGVGAFWGYGPQSGDNWGAWTEGYGSMNWGA